jgi:hypothetical protein
MEMVHGTQGRRDFADAEPVLSRRFAIGGDKGLDFEILALTMGRQGRRYVDRSACVPTTKCEKAAI